MQVESEPEFQTSEPKEPEFKTEQLIFTRGVNIYPVKETLLKISQNFDPKKQLSVYVAGGKLGTGKSSHQNVLLKRLTNKLSDQRTPFDVQMTTTTLTLGVWVYPYPLYASSQPDVQILLVDLEGMDGVKDADVDDTLLNLMKIFTFGMIMSSVFTVHTEMKPDQTTLQILKKAFDVCRTFRANSSIEPPRLFLLMKDMDPRFYKDTIKESRDLIEKQLKDYVEERNQLIIKGRGSPPDSFRFSASKDCSDLVGTPYLQLIDELIEEIPQNLKLDTIENSPITLESFVLLVNTACELLNKKDFEGSLITAIDYIKLERLNQIYTENLNQCVDTCLKKANTVSLDVSIEDFHAQLSDYVNGCIVSFGNQVSQVIRYSTPIKNWTEKHQAIFRATTLSMGAMEIFTSRKIAAEENEELRAQHETILQQQMELTEQAKECAQNLEDQILQMDKEHKEEMKKTQEEYDERLRQAAQEALEKMKILEEKGEAMEEEHKRKIEELNRMCQDKLAEHEAELLEREKEVKHSEEIRKAEAANHAEQMQILKEDCNNQIKALGAEAKDQIRDIERGMHEREIAWKKEDYEQKLAHETAMNQLRIQLSQVQAAKSEKRTSGLFGFLAGVLTEPLKGLATGLVKAFT